MKGKESLENEMVLGSSFLLLLNNGVVMFLIENLSPGFRRLISRVKD